MTHHLHRLDGDTYLASLERDGEALARAAERNLGAAVPGCPGWDVEQLVWHTGGVHRFWGTIARERLQDPQQVTRPDRPSQDGLIAWYRDNLALTVDALRSTDPATPVWTWAPEHDVAWIRRRMAQETAVHSWDAISASQTPPPVDGALAVDGIDEFLEFFVSGTDKAPDLTVHLHATDADGEWLVEVKDGKLDVRHEHAKGDAAVRGSASNLLLLLWRRIPEAEVEVLGDRAALFAFLQASDLT